MKRDVAADIASFIGFKGTFDGSHRAAKKHGLTLIFDSESFDAERAVAYLRELQNKEEKRFSHNEL